MRISRTLNSSLHGVVLYHPNINRLKKTVSGRITKHGSKHIRRMLVQVAYAISRTKDSKLKRFFLRIQKKKGSKIAAVALARKVLCILFHLLTNQEIYQEDTSKRNKSIKIDKTQPSAEISLKEMIDCIVRAGYVVEKKLTKGADMASKG